MRLLNFALVVILSLLMAQAVASFLATVTARLEATLCPF